MANHALSGAHLGTNTESPLGGSNMADLVNVLSPQLIPAYATTAARDAAFAAWVTAGNTMRDGLHCFVTGLGDQTYANSAWVNDTWTNLTLASGWSAYVGSGPSVPGSGPYDGPGVRRVATSTGQLRGWVTCAGVVGSGAGILATPMSSPFRPSKPRSLMIPWEDTGTGRGVTRFEVFTDGQIYSIRGVGANTYLLLDNLRYDL